MDRAITILLFLVLTLPAVAQSAASLKIDIQEKKVVLDEKKEISLRICFENLTDSSFVRYDMNSPVRVLPKDVDLLKNFMGSMSAGCAIYIHDSAMQRMKPYQQNNSELHNKEMTKDKLDSILAVSKQMYLNGTIVLEKNSSSLSSMRVDLSDYRLEKGKYFVQVVYFSGDKTVDYVGLHRLSKDTSPSGPFLFRGCVLSNRVLLQVK